MIVVDTGAIYALLDADDRHHRAVLTCYESQGRSWILPWAVLPEIDYLARKRLGSRVADAFAADVNDGLFNVDGNVSKDMPRAIALMRRHEKLEVGLVDAVVAAQAERHKASAIATVDARHFRPLRLSIRPSPKLIPLDA